VLFGRLIFNSIHEASLPVGLRAENIIGGGSTALIAFNPQNQRVLKFVHESRIRGPEYGVLKFEREVYSRLQATVTSNRLIHCYEYYPTESCYGVESLELEYASKGSLRDYLRKTRPLQTPEYFRWAVQIAEAMIFVHYEGVLHGDLNLANVLLDDCLNAKVADFSFAVILDGSPGGRWAISPTSRYQMGYRPPGMATCIASEVFAFGSVLYEIFTGKRPYEELYTLDLSHREQVDKLVAQKKFPCVDGLNGIGSVILNCWTMAYTSFKAVKVDLDKAYLKA
jgi:serine/threonine protein kinase